MVIDWRCHILYWFSKMFYRVFQAICRLLTTLVIWKAKCSLTLPLHPSTKQEKNLALEPKYLPSPHLSSTLNRSLLANPVNVNGRLSSALGFHMPVPSHVVFFFFFFFFWLRNSELRNWQNMLARSGMGSSLPQLRLALLLLILHNRTTAYVQQDVDLFVCYADLQQFA
jgi:hypothetical protein